MFVVLGTKQRSEMDFRRLLKRADLRFELVKIYSKGSMGLLKSYLHTMGWIFYLLTKCNPTIEGVKT